METNSHFDASDHDEALRSAVLFGVAVNIIMLAACFTTLAWLRPFSSGCRSGLSKHSIPEAAAEIKLEQSKASTCSSVKPAHPIFVSKDLDMQNMLLASANINLFFHSKGSPSSSSSIYRLV
jgi:hypothetical protein